ncbi:MAG: DUF4349 domain-containing protein [Actinomycetota bacterium]
MSRSRVKVLAVSVSVVAALALAGCSGGRDATASAGSASSSREGADSAAAQSFAASKGAAPASARVDAAAADPAALGGRRQVRTADLGLQVDDLRVAAARVRALATAAKGYVQDEKTSTDPAPVPLPGDGGVTTPRPTGQSVLTLRVPEQGLDRLMDQVAGLGRQVSRGQSSDDVTDQYVDVASRLRTQRESVARVRVLLDKATTIGQVVQVESQLTRRQADLESLEARLAALADQSTLATLTVSLSPKGVAAATAVQPGAFVEGLRGGWQAMLASVAVALRVLGALLPFGVLAALVGVPVTVFMRRRRTQPSV